MVLFCVVSLGLLFVYFFLIRPKLYRMRLNSITVITGAVKTGKSALAVHLAIKQYRRALSRYGLSCVFNRLLPLKYRKNIERPYLYSNIPLRNIVYRPVTKSLFLREVRPSFRSVLLFDEASLIHDSQLYRDTAVSTQLLLFYKLFGHETHGGSAFVTTHVLSDVHHALKRTCGDIIYINHSTRFFPFYSLQTLRTLQTSVDESVITPNLVSDISTDSKLYFLPKRVFKYYDPFCYSVLTDSLPVSDSPQLRCRGESLKTSDIPSFNNQISSYLASINSQGGDFCGKT